MSAKSGYVFLRMYITILVKWLIKSTPSILKQGSRPARWTPILKVTYKFPICISTFGQHLTRAHVSMSPLIHLLITCLLCAPRGLKCWTCGWLICFIHVMSSEFSGLTEVLYGHWNAYIQCKPSNCTSIVIVLVTWELSRWKNLHHMHNNAR